MRRGLCGAVICGGSALLDGGPRVVALAGADAVMLDSRRAKP